MSAASEREAWLCPGQGMPPRDIAQFLVANPIVAEAEPILGEFAGTRFGDLLRTSDEDVLRRNEFSAVLCVLAAVAAGRELARSGPMPQFLSGYSVGLWSAMHLAGMLDFPTLLRVVWIRAAMMNETDGARRGAMLAVIGLKEDIVLRACERIATPDEPIEIANFNAPGQYTLAGSRHAIAAVKPQLVEAKAHKIADVPVQGAWHCTLMQSAVPQFRSFLDGIALSAPSVTVIGNVTGGPLPAENASLRDELADHLARPVRWIAVVRSLLQHQVGVFTETGYGNTLTKFGMFIERSVTHRTWAQAARPGV